MMKSERQLIDVAEARGYVETFMADPILKMAANAVLNNTPRVDAVEVVRCKDCVDCEPHRLKSGQVYFRRCCFYDIEVEANFFCANGERKAEDGK